MTLIKWNNPGFLSDFLDELSDRNIFPENSKMVPRTNIQDLEKEYTIDLAIPGYKKEEIDIQIDNQLLTVSSEMEGEKEEKNENFTRKEFHKSTFSRSFTLPKNVEMEKISAEFKDGVLKIDLPKKEIDKSKITKKVEIS